MHDISPAALSCPLPASPPSDPASPRPVILVVGLSGAGTSTVLQVLEDLHFFTADGLPPNLVPEFYTMLQRPGMEHFKGLALGVDFRRNVPADLAQVMEALSTALGQLRAAQVEPQLFFLEAKAAVILRRYATTRRPHPLEREGLSLEQSVAEEMRRLQVLRDSADLVLDTSSFSLHDLRREIQRRWSQVRQQNHLMRIHIVSFGFKYGMPNDADLVFDMRCLPNPHFVENLRPLSGLDAPIAHYVFAESPAQLFAANLLTFLAQSLPLYDQEGRYRLTLALGCTGGRHRSVAMAEYLAQKLRQNNYPITVEHRHLNLGG